LSFDILFPETLELAKVVSALDTVEGVREFRFAFRSRAGRRRRWEPLALRVQSSRGA